MTNNRFICGLLVLMVLIMCSPTAGAYDYDIVGTENFTRSLQYNNEFSDNAENEWYYESICSVYEYSLMNGIGDGLFNPKGSISLAETITVATRINAIYFLGYMPVFEFETEPKMWYDPYVEYAIDANILSRGYSNYNATATRAQFAEILANSIDPIDLEPCNIVDDGAIPDVPMSADYADAVYLLYRAGILTGSDSSGTFNPDSTITRAEAAAIITRIVDPSLRKSIELVGEY